MKRAPQLKAVMTPFPYYIESSASVVEARAMMEEHDIRHLPVTRHGELKGILSERDARSEANAEKSVAESCSLDVYVVDFNARLDSVAQHMADQHLEYALITRKDRLAGIFTVTDACRCLADLIRSEFPDDSDPLVA